MADAKIEPIWNLPRVELSPLNQVREDRPAAVLTGTRAWNTVGSLLSLPIVVQAEPPTTEIDFLESLSEGLPAHVRVVYGVGGGRVADAAKYVAWKHNLPVVLIPTALSVDGFFTSLVALRQDGTIKYQNTGPAERVIVDMDVISTAPAHIRGTGIVEILSMTTGLLDWKLAADRQKNPPEERFQPWAASIAAAIAQQAYKIAAGVGQGRPDALRNLLDLMCVEVQLTNQLGHNRPQEGSEQYFAYAIEPRVTKDSGVPYADVAGPGIIVAAALHRQNVAPIRDTLLSAGVHLGKLSRDDVVETLRILPTYVHQHNLPYSILHESTDLTSPSMMEFFRSAGIDLAAQYPL